MSSPSTSCDRFALSPWRFGNNILFSSNCDAFLSTVLSEVEESRVGQQNEITSVCLRRPPITLIKSRTVQRQHRQLFCFYMLCIAQQPYIPEYYWSRCTSAHRLIAQLINTVIAPLSCFSLFSVRLSARNVSSHSWRRFVQNIYCRLVVCILGVPYSHKYAPYNICQ